MPTTTLFPIQLTPTTEARETDDLVPIILAASDDQLARTPVRDQEDAADFLMSSDALNAWRMVLRLREERPGEPIDAFTDDLFRMVCDSRGYDPDEFESTKYATENRARSPFGLNPLKLAYERSQLAPIRLLHPDVAESDLATAVAGIARQLQSVVGRTGTIYLPIEQLRSLLCRRKTAVSGTVIRLVKAGILELVNDTYYTSRAREYRFVGVPGQHFAEANLE